MFIMYLQECQLILVLCACIVSVSKVFKRSLMPCIDPVYGFNGYFVTTGAIILL